MNERCLDERNQSLETNYEVCRGRDEYQRRVGKDDKLKKFVEALGDGAQALDFGLWTLGFGLWTLDFGLCKGARAQSVCSRVFRYPGASGNAVRVGKG